MAATYDGAIQELIDAFAQLPGIVHGIDIVLGIH